MAVTRDYYEILSLERTASGDEIKRSYRRMAMKYHPDRNPGDAEAEAKFKECAEAYEVLSDSERRAAYDKYGHAGLRGTPGHDFNSMNVEDIFSMFNDIFGAGFGGGNRNRSRRRGVARGYDLETEVEITFEEVLLGASRDVEFKRLDVCRTCAGTGGKPGVEAITCPTCQGQGQVARAELGGMFRMVTVCPQCNGRGKMVAEKCSDCKGAGRVSIKRTIEVRVPPGIHDGQAVRISGEGEPPPPELSPSGTGVHGDLHVVVRVRPHRVFQRDRNDLVLMTPVTFAQASLGADIQVPTLEAATVVTIPAGTQHGKTFRIAEHGLPDLRSGKRGSLVVVIQLSVPRKLSDEQRELLRQYAETESVEVNPAKSGWWERFKEKLSGS
ncbi:MAG: molecular chaperone DnaJ [Phycisphaerales bacterium]